MSSLPSLFHLKTNRTLKSIQMAGRSQIGEANDAGGNLAGNSGHFPRQNRKPVAHPFPCQRWKDQQRQEFEFGKVEKWAIGSLTWHFAWSSHLHFPVVSAFVKSGLKKWRKYLVRSFCILIDWCLTVSLYWEQLLGLFGVIIVIAVTFIRGFKYLCLRGNDSIQLNFLALGKCNKMGRRWKLQSLNEPLLKGADGNMSNMTKIWYLGPVYFRKIYKN